MARACQIMGLADQQSFTALIRPVTPAIYSPSSTCMTISVLHNTRKPASSKGFVISKMGGVGSREGDQIMSIIPVKFPHKASRTALARDGMICTFNIRTELRMTFGRSCTRPSTATQRGVQAF